MKRLIAVFIISLFFSGCLAVVVEKFDSTTGVKDLSVLHSNQRDFYFFRWECDKNGNQCKLIASSEDRTKK